MDVRLIDANSLYNALERKLKQLNPESLSGKFFPFFMEAISDWPTIDKETLPIVKELRREIDRLVNDGKQDLWAVERKRREEAEEKLYKVTAELDEALEAICVHCQDFPCQKSKCYWWRGDKKEK